MKITTASTDVADVITDQWIELARSQRSHDSHVLPEANRATVRDAVVRHAIANELLVATEDEEVVGFVMFALESGEYEQDVSRGLVQNLYVKPAHRGEGIGSSLLETAESALESRGVDTIALEAMAANEDARRFYRRHGYAPHRVEFEKSTESDTL